MQPFVFHAKTKTYFAEGAVEETASRVTELGAENPLVVTDPGIVRAGILDRVTSSLEKAGIPFDVFDEIEPNPRDTTILEGADLMEQVEADLVIGLGGGSPMDAAKAIAVMATNKGPLESYCGAGADPWPVSPPPVIAIPTTAGTGAEVSGAAMVNLTAEQRKADIFGRSIQPAVAILDPLLTVGLPPRLTALTGIDALSHALEAYTGKYASPITDALAEKAIRMVVDNVRQAYADGENLAARSNMLVASTMAVMAAAAGLGVVHALAQTVGGYYDAPHGLSIAVCLPYGVEYNLFTTPEKFARVAEILGAEVSGASTFSAAKAVVPALEALLADLDIDADLRSLGVQEEDVPRLAEICMLDGCTPMNLRAFNEDAFVDLFQQALE